MCLEQSHNHALCPRLKVNVQSDHVHMAIVIPPRIAVAVASVIRYIKTKSTGLLKRKFPFIGKIVCGRPSILSVGYCISTVGMNEKINIKLRALPG